MCIAGQGDRHELLGGVVMYEDRDQLPFVARDVVTVGLRVSGDEQRTLVALGAIAEHVAPSQMDSFCVALIEHIINTVRPFLAVYGDELTGPEVDRPVWIRGVGATAGSAQRRASTTHAAATTRRSRSWCG